MKIQIITTASFLTGSQQGLKESPNKLLTIKFCLKLSSVKSSAQTCEFSKDVKHSLFISISHSLKFWILGELESANFGL